MDPHCRDPLAPPGLTATPGTEQVELSWGSVEGATGYSVYRAFESGVPDESTEIARVLDTAFTHTYLDPTRTYYYRVSASNPWAEGPLSNEVGATPLPPHPEAPAGVAAAPGNTEVEVSWESVDGAEGYHLYWDVTAGASGNLIDDAESPYVHTDLTNGTRYYYRVCANNAGGEGPLSAEVSAVPQVPAPGAPTNLTAVPGDGQVTLSWRRIAGASSYVVYWGTEPQVDTDSPAVTRVPGPPYVHLGRANGTTYYYRVSAMNPGGESPLSLEVSATPQPPAPATPGFLQAEAAGSHDVALSWGSVTRADTYELFWDTEPGVTAADTSIGGLAATDYTHSALPNGTTYYYRVRARNGGGVSSLSSEGSAALRFQVETEQKLTGAANTAFGRSVAISGDTMVVGAIYENDGAGAAYVFERTNTGWHETTKLVAIDAQAVDWFGWSVAISGDYLVVTAPREDSAGAEAGAAYVFERTDNGWQAVNKLVASDPHSDAWFGRSVAISGDYLVVGARAEDSGSDIWVGAAYVFERQATGWQHARRLAASDAQEEDWFGGSVAIDGTRLVVGAPGRGGGSGRYGAVFVFERGVGGWQEVQKLTKSDAQYNDWFGYSVAISGSHVGVGTRDPNECYLFSPEI
jgi:fibronectin type 3 domain-containing protein